eukprot:CAMPEP_0171896736 /NCGR_PEP_ID=MMETSP0992-20121227/47735_1 /TAXON_ID=483369 /ORGANISM="non described non described, Strain CCMP2098" /LENGTH=79 /DNA_ID=CAMNT_0012524765 /DNA_START=92 /DNA_END=331 /DNA_ORIENTATION=+
MTSKRKIKLSDPNIWEHLRGKDGRRSQLFQMAGLWRYQISTRAATPNLVLLWQDSRKRLETILPETAMYPTECGPSSKD